MARQQTELDVDVGEAEIAVEQQHPLAGPRQGMRQGDGEPGLADPALAGGDRQNAATGISGVIGRAASGCLMAGDAADSVPSAAFMMVILQPERIGFPAVLRCRSRSARKSGVSGTSPSDAPGPVPASVSSNPPARAAASTPPSRRARSRRVATSMVAPISA